MKAILLILLLLSLQAHADSAANCSIVNGIYDNSSEEVTDLRFETLADVFSITNANTLSMTFDGKPIKAIRTKLVTDRQTRMVYTVRSRSRDTRVLYITLDRTPNEVGRSRFFFGNILMTNEIDGLIDWRDLVSTKLYRYNFYCSL